MNERVDIHYRVVPSRGGFCPRMAVNGGRETNCGYWWPTGEAEAEAIAQDEAVQMAARYVGDWDVVISRVSR